MVPVVFLGGDVFVRPLDDLVAQSHNNNFGSHCNFKKPDLQKFLTVTNLFQKTIQKDINLKFEVQGVLRSKIL